MERRLSPLTCCSGLESRRGFFSGLRPTSSPSRRSIGGFIWEDGCRPVCARSKRITWPTTTVRTCASTFSCRYLIGSLGPGGPDLLHRCAKTTQLRDRDGGPVRKHPLLE